jgi:anti-anti-sigma factor
VGDDYLWVWADRSGRVTVLKVKGELDASNVTRFAAAAARELRQTAGPVAVDLSFLDFLDCAGARSLAAVVRTVPLWRLTGVRGIRPSLARLLELTGTDLPALVSRPCRGRGSRTGEREVEPVTPVCPGRAPTSR